jgi:hypothetical protein
MDGADESLARQRDGAGRRAATDIDSATVVVDPQLPREMRDALAGATGKLVPYQGPVPVPVSPRNGAGGCMVIAGIFFFVATLGFVNGASGGGYTMLALGAVVTLFALLARPSGRDIAAAHAPVTQHRRYVLPATDIDVGHWQLWKRAVDARNRIFRAEVVSAGQIDSVQVAEVLPEPGRDQAAAGPGDRRRRRGPASGEPRGLRRPGGASRQRGAQGVGAARTARA